ncbi:MAG: hypothetical protein HY821_06670 [Acidobacteria bacterium]|nr:hypothetical protein [Acidobacteriota bacterium]
MQKAFVLFILILAATMQAPAQSRTFDIYSFTPPPGWSFQDGRDHLSYTSIDQARRTFCMLGVYSSRAGSGRPDAEFAEEWKTIVQQSFRSQASPRPAPGNTAAGVSYLNGSAEAQQQNGAPAHVRLVTFQGGNRVGSMMFVATHRAAMESCEPAIQNLLNSVRLSVQGAAAPQPAAPQTSSPPATGAANPAGSSQPAPNRSGIAGVWMGFRPLGMGSYEPRPRWYTFFEDGQVFEDIPREGFAGWNSSASKATEEQRPYWGTYTFSNGSGVITKPGARFTTSIRMDADGGILLDSDKFIRCSGVDGLRLEGSWTSFSDPNDPALNQLPAGQRPILRLARSGQFLDEGIFLTILRNYTEQAPPSGAGTYEIRAFTLILRYRDGTVRQVAFTGLLKLDPGRDNNILFLGRTQFNRQK